MRFQSCSTRCWRRRLVVRCLKTTHAWRSLSDSFREVTLITPNIPETAALLGVSESQDVTTLKSYGVRLLADGPRAVLIKGGHGVGDESVDMLVASGAAAATAAAAAAPGAAANAVDAGTVEVTTFRGPRLPGTVRGTGCALSSAIAAGLSREESIVGACRLARDYVAGLFPKPPGD